jgi:hypothetical protein
LPGVIDCQRTGHALTIIASGGIAELNAVVNRWEPVMVKTLDLGLEDIFIALMKVQGYKFDIN